MILGMKDGKTVIREEENKREEQENMENKDAVVNKEETKMSDVANETAPQAEEVEVEQEQVESEPEIEVVSTEQPAEEPLQKLIPPITVEPLPKTEEVIKTEDGSIFLQVMVDAASGIVTGCQYYRVDKNGYPMLSTDTYVKVSKSRIETSTDYTILYILRNFNLKITEDNIKEAFDKSKEMIRDQSRRTVIGSSDIIDIYREMMKFAIADAKVEMKMQGIKTRHYNLTDDYIDIHTDWLEKVLANIEPINKKRFLSNLRIIEIQMKTKIIVSNRKGGYAYNTTGNIRVYRFMRSNAIGNF